MIYARFLCLFILLGAFPAAAHEYWIEPQDYTISSSGDVIADTRNGQLFEGNSYTYNTNDYEKYEFFLGQSTQKLEGILGQRPAVQVKNVSDGLGIIAITTKPSWLSYAKWEKFQKFIDHKDFKIDKAAHLAMGFPEEGFRETYRRFAKSIVGIGNAQGQDRLLGLEIELVALLNPYTDDTSGGMKVQAYYDGQPMADVQIELFDKAANGEVVVTLHRTDDKGIATLPIESGHSYLVDTVKLRKAPEGNEEKAVWETLWASLTYAKD